MAAQITFKSSAGEYGYLTNFYAQSFMAEGIQWKTSEHYYQWKKLKFIQSLGESVSEEFFQSIIDARTPMAAKMLGHKKCNHINEWNAIKVREMVLILREKFKHPFLRMHLLATGRAELIGETRQDDFWGTGEDGKGANMLGKCLMQVRQELRREIIAQMNEELDNEIS